MPTTLRPAVFRGYPVLSQQEELLRIFLGAWPDQGRRLLYINCGNGHMLSRLRSCGFDVTACEHDREARQRALRRAPRGTEIFAASDAHLPFDDGEFDWTLLDAAAPGGDLASAVAEAYRTASRGFAVAFWNALSLYGLLWRSAEAPIRLRWPRDVWRLVRDCGGRAPACRSLFFGPPACWRARGLSGTLWRLPLPLGAWCVLRCDFGPSRPLTGLFLPLRPLEDRLEPQSTLSRQPQRLRVPCRSPRPGDRPAFSPRPPHPPAVATSEGLRPQRNV